MLSMRVGAIAFLAAVGFQTILLGQSMPTYWRLADPEAQMLAGINLKAVMNSQAAGEWKSQLQKAAGGAMPLEMIQGMDESGVLGELFQHVDRVFLSMSEIPQNTNKAQGTVALVGDFDLAALRKFMAKQGGVKSLYRGVEVWQNGKAADNVMIALASPQVLALGDKASIRKAVSHFAVGDGSLLERPVYKRAVALAQENDIWIAGQIPAAASATLEGPAQMMKSLESFELGVRMQSGLGLDLNLYAHSPEEAAGIAAALKGLAQMAANNSGNAQASDLLSRLQMGTEGERIQMSAAWTASELTAAMRESGSVKSGRAAKTPSVALNRPAEVTTPKVAEPIKPKGPLKVHIYNPDGGVQEVELTKN
jgi:hypothetical protein